MWISGRIWGTLGSRNEAADDLGYWGITHVEHHAHTEGMEISPAPLMLNIYAGFEMAAVRSSYGDLGGAHGVLVPLATEVEAWLESNPDADIEDDLAYIRKFIANLESRGGAEAPTSPNPPNPWPQD